MYFAPKIYFVCFAHQQERVVFCVSVVIALANSQQLLPCGPPATAWHRLACRGEFTKGYVMS